jgi:hypothetical protein
VSTLSALRQINYLSVKSAKEFKQHMEEEFDFLVTACVFDVTVSFTSNAWSVERVYGSPGFEYPEHGKLVQIVRGIFGGDSEVFLGIYISIPRR